MDDMDGSGRRGLEREEMDGADGVHVMGRGLLQFAGEPFPAPCHRTIYALCE